MPRVFIRDLGPFREVAIELRPLTVFVGKNSVGKSFLLYLIWLLESAYPDWSVLIQEAERRGAAELVSKIVRDIKQWRIPSTEFKQLVRMFVEALPQAIATTLKNLLEKTFGIELSSIVRHGAESASIIVEGRVSSIHFEIRRDGTITASYVKYNPGLVEHYDLNILPSGEVKVLHGGRELLLVSAPHVKTISEVDILRVIMSVLTDYIVNAFGLVFASGIPCALLVDGRAGVARTLFRPYVEPSITKGLLYPDEYYLNLYRFLAETLGQTPASIRLELAEELLRELGVEFRALREHGIWTLRVRTWTGHEMYLEYAPSGIREVAVMVLALTIQGFPIVIFIEEPEAHLHLKAQKYLAKLIAKSINVLGKHVILTTHSDYLIYVFTNLIALHKIKNRARELGYSEDEVLSPDKVAVYLVKQEDTYAKVERLEVTENGIDESHFEEVIRELADERSRIFTYLQEVHA